MNSLYLGDCLYVLRDNIPNKSVDLVYIDPPFNSKRDYNIFFDDKEIQTQRIAFEDTWSLKNIQDSLTELHTLQTDNLYFLLLTYQKVAPHAFPYLTMMALRILELHRVLKDTGSFYLHCDPTMSHYLKTVCDIIFGVKNFQNEINWKRTSGHSDAVGYGSAHDIIFFYTKNLNFSWNQIFQSYSDDYIEQYYKHKDNDGRRWMSGDLSAAGLTGGGYEYVWKGIKRIWRCPETTMNELEQKGKLYYTKNGIPRIKRYLDESKGIPCQDNWDDIEALRSWHNERLGYPTQKPKALLERIIKASSNEGDIVLDGFCGCGTALDAAESLNRKWIGIDISPIAISLIKRRLKDTYGKQLSKFEIRGVPTDEASAKKLWEENPFAFQDWWLTEFEVFSTTYGTKGADKGVDGIGQYIADHQGNTLRAAFQVKGGGKVKSSEIDSLLGILEKHKCQLGVFLTIAEPTKPMMETATASGFFEAGGFQYPRIQILTLEEFFAGKRPKLPTENVTFKSAQLKGKKVQQISLEL